MKKRFCVRAFIVLLAACQSSQLSIQEIQNVPTKVQDVMNEEYTLQLINEGKEHAYIVFQSTGTVTAELEVAENILNIKLAHASQENDELQQYAYKLTRGDAQFDTI
ncbi:MAG: peptidylprolyl isomerase [Solibacillus sp.]